jgi:homoserine dehydrogenase
MHENVIKKTIAFLGVGTVGSGVYRVLKNNSEVISHRDGVCFEIKKILVSNVKKKRDIDFPDGVLTESFEEILNDKNITMVAEFMGGVMPALEYVEALLKAGKTVVTANKELLASYWPRLEQAAKSSGAGLYYEAAVGGGIPIIRTINDSLQANKINQLVGIINGTTNYILTKMSDEKRTYDDVLKESMQQGIAEPDPTNDVEGYDAMYKLSILSSLAFHAKVPPEKIFVEGITGIESIDIEFGQQLGYEIKLLAIGKRKGYEIEVRVHPTFIQHEHPLSSVRDSYNAIFVNGDAVGNLMLYGKGAGAEPTASAIISDLIYASKYIKHRYTSFGNIDSLSKDIEFSDDWKSKYYMRIQSKDEPGVLSMVSGKLGKHGVSLESVIQRGNAVNNVVPVIFLTHETNEKAMMAAAQEISHIPEIDKIGSIIRVESDI